MPKAVVWRHFTGSADERGVFGFIESGNANGTHAISGGGYAEPILSDNSNQGSEETNGNSATGMCPIVGMFSVYNSAADATRWNVAFAAPPGSRIRAHVFCVVDD